MNLATFKRAFLLALLALTGWAAVVTAAAVMDAGRSRAVIEWALKCAVAVGYLLLISFAGLAAVERRFWRFPAMAGMVLAAVLLLLLPVFVGWEIRAMPGAAGRAADAAHLLLLHAVETLMLTAGLLCVLPFAMFPPLRRVGRIAQMTVIVYLTTAYGATLCQIWNIGGHRLEDAVITLLIPAGACLMGVFVMHKFFAIPARHPDGAVAESIHLRCPRCGHEQDLPEGRSQCSVCRLRFAISLEEPCCPNCGFNLHRLTRPVCPECGLHLDRDDLPSSAAATAVREGRDPGGPAVIGLAGARSGE